MKKSNKKLYESIMYQVSRSIKSSLDESLFGSQHQEDQFCATISGCETLIISDPCYVLEDYIYDHSWGPEYKDGIIKKGMNIVGLVHGTDIGDGAYPSDSHVTYGVDSGTLGIFDKKFCKDDDDITTDCTTIHIDPNTPHKICLKYTDGTFDFYVDNVCKETIYTSGEEEEDEFEEDEFEEEEKKPTWQWDEQDPEWED